MNRSRDRFGPWMWAAFAALSLLTFLLCVCGGSVGFPLGGTLRILWNHVWGIPIHEGPQAAIILSVRLPRVLCTAFSGAALSLCGAAMQGLLRNPLADGSTMGVSAGASLGAVLAMAFGFTLPGLPFAGPMAMAMAFACGALLLILSLAYALDRALQAHTMILIGVVFTMLVSSLISIAMVFAGDRLKSITFWTLGSLAGSSATEAGLLLGALALCGGVILFHAPELNAFALGEEEAAHLGVAVKRVKLTMLIAVSALIGTCVSIGGNIGFVGLVIPHMLRRVTGPNHGRLLPASLFGGAVFLMLADLLARTVCAPLELPVGAVTSVIGSVVFVAIFWRTGRKKARP